MAGRHRKGVPALAVRVPRCRLCDEALARFYAQRLDDIASGRVSV